jgi:hypothetical protein
VIQPTEGALDHPATGQEHKLPGFLGTQHHCQTEFEAFCDPSHQSTTVAIVHPNFPQFFATSWQSTQQPASTVPVLHAGNSHYGNQQQSQCVHQNMALRLLTIFPASNPRSWNCCTLDALAVQTTSRRVFMATALLP